MRCEGGGSQGLSAQGRLLDAADELRRHVDIAQRASVEQVAKRDHVMLAPKGVAAATRGARARMRAWVVATSLKEALTLEELDVSSNHLGYSGIEALTKALCEVPALQTLNLSYNEPGDRFKNVCRF